MAEEEKKDQGQNEQSMWEGVWGTLDSGHLTGFLNRMCKVIDFYSLLFLLLNIVCKCIVFFVAEQLMSFW